VETKNFKEKVTTWSKASKGCEGSAKKIRRQKSKRGLGERGASKKDLKEISLDKKILHGKVEKEEKEKTGIGEKQLKGKGEEPEKKNGGVLGVYA